MISLLTVGFKKLHPNAQLPTRGSQFALGYDLYCVEDNSFVIDRTLSKMREWKSMYRELMPMESHLFHTGWSFSVPEEYGVIFRDRSGMGGKREIHHMAGVCDSDYRGEYLVKLINLSQTPQRIYGGDRIIQMIFIKRVDVEFIERAALGETDRGSGGFGSTGA